MAISRKFNPCFGPRFARLPFTYVGYRDPLWGCGTCWIWTPSWINTCWSESTPAGEETRVASEQIEQTAIAEEKK
jgi:hypothetical protein